MSSGRRKAAWLSVFFLGALAAYARVIHAFFLSDDFGIIDTIFRGGPFSLWSGGTSAGLPCFRPLAALSLWADVTLFGWHPAGFHVHALLLHATCSLLVAIIGTRLLGTRPAGFAAGVAFLLLPSHTEAVAWISSRADLLATLFTLGAFAAYLAFRAGEGRGWLGMALFLQIVALLAKESAVVLPAVVVAYEALIADGRERRITLASPRQAARRALSRAPLLFIAVTTAFLAFRRWRVGSWIGGYGSDAIFHIDLRSLGTNLAVYPLRATGASLPLALASGWRITVVKLVVLGLIAWGLVRLYRAPAGRDRSVAGFLAAAFFIALAPVINLASMGISPVYSDCERFLYLPSVFSALLIAAGGRFLGSDRARRGATVVLALIYVAGLWHANESWRAAGLITRGAVGTLAAAYARDARLTEGVILINQPDTLKGAWVFHNGFAQAFALATGQEPHTLYVLGLQQLRRPDDPVGLLPDGDGWRVHCTGHLVEWYPSVDPTVVTLSDRTTEGFRFVLHQAASHYPVFVFTGGTLERWR